MALSAKSSRQQDVAKRLVELMAGFAPVQAKPMFGGYGLYWQGLMFALVAQERLYFKADELSAEAFSSRGLGPFTFESKGRAVSLKYFEAPAEVYDEPQHMAGWARMAYACALRHRKAPQRVPVDDRAAVPRKIVLGVVEAVTAQTIQAPQAGSPQPGQVGRGSAPAEGLAALQNLGPKSLAMLAQAGVESEAQLRQLGAVVAYARTKAVCRQASLNLLWALGGALSGRPWQVVAELDRASLLMALEDVARHMPPQVRAAAVAGKLGR